MPRLMPISSLATGWLPISADPATGVSKMGVNVYIIGSVYDCSDLHTLYDYIGTFHMFNNPPRSSSLEYSQPGTQYL
jgi:hypothetical protein